MAKIVFWLGPAVETWDPLTALDTGIGGSETAAIHMTRQLSLLGHNIKIYADVGCMFARTIDADVGKFPHKLGLVEWFSYKEFKPGEVECDLFISSRQPEARRKLQPKCKQAWLWMHDLHCGPDWDNVIGTDYDKVLCLSRWARERFLDYYPGVDPSKVMQTSNGLDSKRFVGWDERSSNPASSYDGRCWAPWPGEQHLPHLVDGKLVPRPLRVTWSSSPDRGLDRLLDLWPLIHSRIDSTASLHVYYGFETWRALAERHGLVGDLKRISLLEARLAAMSNQGVVFHGRRGQQEIADSYMQSQLWLYPTTFEEVSCITAMEAKAAGCKIVATRCGALPETVPGAWFVDLPVNGRAYEDRFLESVRSALQDDSVMVMSAPAWSVVAAQWSVWFPVAFEEFVVAS
jgi:glycosyltransferase involved in cell wall biosynthesis